MNTSKNLGSNPSLKSAGSKDSSCSNAGPSCKRRYSNNEETDSSSDEEYEKDNDKVEWIEESSESDPEIECEFWDEDCVVIPREVRDNAVQGYHLMPTCAREPVKIEPPFKLQKSYDGPILNNELLQDKFKEEFILNWNSKNSYKHENVLELIMSPFKCCVINNFLGDINILNKTREEMYEIEWNRRCLDLYEFFQSKEKLENVNFTNISLLHEFLKLQVMPWVSELTGLELTKVSASCSLYSDTDYLLVHDDHRGDRLVAFVLYLTDPKYGTSDELWTCGMGGALELFSKDCKGHPLNCVREILPRNNQFVFFQVTNDSYHQVAEVLTKDHCRYSINGWFHANEVQEFELPQWETPKSGIFSDNCLLPSKCTVKLSEWINKEYLTVKSQKQIQLQIEEHSEISLVQFFHPAKFDEICEDIERGDITWNPVGPPNRRQYFVASEENLPIVVEDFMNLFKSEALFALLKKYTDLELTSLRIELQKWTPGCYSLLSEHNWESNNELDLVMYLGCPKNLRIIGGQTMYVSQEEKIQNALITLEPNDNCLNIVYRDTARIVKNVSRHSMNHCYYMLICCYRE